jgi:uncharacterized protein (TIGR02186 family)
MKRCACCFWPAAAWIFPILLPISACAGEALIVALEPARVDISAGFTGASVRAVGAMQGSGDLVVKVTGPPQDVTLSRKIRLGLFWVGGETVVLGGAPSLLFLRATAPIASLLPPGGREEHALLLDGVKVHVEPQLQADAAQVWRKAYFVLKQNDGYYREDKEAISVSANGQFSVDIRLPGNLQTGTYTVETLLVRSGKVVGRTLSEFEVHLVGIEQWIWNAAHGTPWLFGSLLTLAAMLLGLALTAIPQRLRWRSQG